VSVCLSEIVFTLDGVRQAYAAGVRPAEIIAETLRRIDAAEDPGIFLHVVDRDALMVEAESLGSYDPERPLWGIPYAIKDNIDLAGAPTTAACPAFTYTADQDAYVVAQLREAGALAVGKTNLDQFATGLVGVRTPYPVPRNALDPAIVPGGSSSGSAVAVARGIVPFALGTDTAGSGRVPAGLNNIVGLKPSLGALSSTGLVPACRTLDTISVFAQTVDEAYDVFRVVAGCDPRDAYSRAFEFSNAGGAPPKLRVGIPDAESLRFDGDKIQAMSFKASVAALVDGGGEIIEIDFAPFFCVAELLYDGAWVAEREIAMANLLANTPDAIHPVTREIVKPGLKLSAADAFRGIYRLAEFKRTIAPVLETIDLLCVPTMPRFVTRTEIETDPIGPNALLGTYTNFVNLLDLCGLAVPTAPRSDGRPGSVTLLAKAGCDALLASVGRNIERLGGRTLGATNWPVPPIPRIAAAATAEEIEIAVCGAHMSGLPLNHELTERGGRFLRATKTAPIYRLFALQGGPPHRPGMVRTGAGDGSAIAVEVWALPRAQVGGFLAGIPSPLGLGTVQLGDGTAPIGFVCEAIGTLDAEDVTALGSWRAFLARGAA
jgi:allophanate hydrolase